MPAEELRHEIEDGVVFWGLEQEGQLLGIMGIQDKSDVTLIRHAYVIILALEDNSKGSSYGCGDFFKGKEGGHADRIEHKGIALDVMRNALWLDKIPFFFPAHNFCLSLKDVSRDSRGHDYPHEFYEISLIRLRSHAWIR